MKKIINITIGHTVFHIEDDAFNVLEKYLAGIKSKLGQNDDATEIINDIEIGIAEKFLARGRSERNAITRLDVEMVIKEMGSAEDIGTEGKEEKSEQVERTALHKRLYRNPDDVVIAGVASGIAAYFGIDPLVVRVLFVVLVFMGSAGFWIYIVLWLLVPVARTSSQRLEMYGEPVTLSNIRDLVDDTIENIKKKDKKGLRKIVAFPVEVVRTIVGALRRVVRMFFPIIRFFLGLLFIFIGGAIFAGVVIFSISVLPNLSLLVVDPSIKIYIDSVFSSPVYAVWLSMAIVITVFIPCIVLFDIGESLLRNKNILTLKKMLVLLCVWSISLGLSVSAIIHELLLQGFVVR